LYTHWQRTFLHPSLLAFDAPSREECTARRPRSNTPQQALALLNDPTYVEAARVFAERILREGGPSAEQRLDFAFRLALSRTPTQTSGRCCWNCRTGISKTTSKTPRRPSSCCASARGLDPTTWKPPNGLVDLGGPRVAESA
jgi:hypothetical protein